MAVGTLADRLRFLMESDVINARDALQLLSGEAIPMDLHGDSLVPASMHRRNAARRAARARKARLGRP